MIRYDEVNISPGYILVILVDVVSKNGNLLLNSGPKADGTIPRIQKEHVRKLGE